MDTIFSFWSVNYNQDEWIYHQNALDKYRNIAIIPYPLSFLQRRPD